MKYFIAGLMEWETCGAQNAMGTPVQVRFLYPAPFKFEIGLIHGIRPFCLSHLIFCLSSFYEFTAKVGNKIPQILETKYHKSWKQKAENKHHQFTQGSRKTRRTKPFQNLAFSKLSAFFLFLFYFENLLLMTHHICRRLQRTNHDSVFSFNY